MTLNPEQKLDYLYREYARLSNITMEYLKEVYGDIKLFGAIGASVIIWKPVADLVSSIHTELAANLVLLLGFLGIEIILGIISSFNLVKQSNVWFYVVHLKAYELKISEILETLDENSRIFWLYQSLEESKYINGLYRTAFVFFLLYVKLSATIFPFLILCFVKLSYAFIFLSFSALNTVVLAIAAKRIYRYNPGIDLVGFRYVWTHIIHPGPAP